MQWRVAASGFLISFAGYLFNAVTAFLGVLVFFQRSIAWRLLAGAMFAITLPYFFFAGARSHFLAAVAAFYPDISVLWASSADPKTGHSGDCVLLLE